MYGSREHSEVVTCLGSLPIPLPERRTRHPPPISRRNLPRVGPTRDASNVDGLVMFDLASPHVVNLSSTLLLLQRLPSEAPRTPLRGLYDASQAIGAVRLQVVPRRTGA